MRGTAGMHAWGGSAPREAATYGLVPPLGSSRDNPPEGATPGRPPASLAASGASGASGAESLGRVCPAALAPASPAALRRSLGAAETRRSSLGSRPSLPNAAPETLRGAPSVRPLLGPARGSTPAALHSRTALR